MSDEETEDPRLVHIKTTTLRLLGIDASYWDELIWKEENQAIFKDFLDLPSSVLLLVYFDHNEKLTVSLDIPAHKQMPHMISYFMKKSIVISPKIYKQEIMFGNICNIPLSQYQQIFEKVLYPIFSNTSNNARWPKEIAKDVILHFQDFRKTLTYHFGVAEGRTVLIISEIAKLIENFDINEISSGSTTWELRDILNSITEMLCNWIPVVKEVLELTSEDILLKVQQGPTTEVNFWKERKINLNFIQNQLNDPSIEKMILALEYSENHHFPLFKALLQNVAEALDEATEIYGSLSAISDELQKLESCEFTKLIEGIPSTMKIITTAWTNSKYFNRVPSRISVLIQKTCFFLIEKVEIFLNPTQLFKSDENEMKEKVKISVDTCNAFLKSYYECREMYDQENKTYPWEFPDERVFDCFQKFLERLNKVYEIFEASEVYNSLPEYKILGIQQFPFKMRLNELASAFKEIYELFVQSTYNALDLKSNAFIEDYNVFSIKVDEFDHKMGTTLGQACISCSSSEDCFKLMNLVQNLLKRPLVNLEFKKLITSLLSNIYMELLAAKKCYDSLMLLLESDHQLIYKNLPSASGILQWSLDLQKKLEFPINSLQKVENYFINAEDADLILRTYKEMEELLSKFQKDIFGNWQTVLDAIKENLENPLFISDDRNRLLLNFSPEILDIAQEIRYVKMIKKDNLLPAGALGMGENLNKILQSYSLLACTTQWYNDLCDNLMDFEEILVKDEWEKINRNLKEGLDHKWTKSDLHEYSESIYMTTKSLSERINQAKENVQEMLTFIDTWNNSAVFVRDQPDSLVNFEMFLTAKMRQQIYYVIETSTQLYRAMEENLLLFQCNPESEEWKKYILYLDSVIEDGLKKSLKHSLQYLVENTNGKNKKLAPFLRINMELRDDITFVPSLDKNQQGSLFILCEAIIENLYRPATEVRQIADPDKDYLESITQSSDLNSLKNKVFLNIESGTKNILNKLVDYQHYEDLWVENIEAALDDFILYGPLPDTKTEEEYKAQLDIPSEIKPPTEEEFKTQIGQFDMLQKKIEDIPSEILIESWLLLNVTSFKESLLLLIRNWSLTYKKKLVELKSQGKLRKLEDDGDT